MDNDSQQDQVENYEEPENQSENFLNEGNDDSFSDSFEDDESGENQQETGYETEKPLYTPQEMRALDWEQVDTSRIPPEQMPFYKSMQAAFTKKRQAQADELRKLAKNGNPQNGAPNGLNVAEYARAFQYAQGIVKNAMPDADELDPAYMAVVQGVTGEIVNEQKEQRKNRIKVNEALSNARNKYGENFRAVDEAAKQILDCEYPASVTAEVMAAANAGNLNPIYALLDEAYKRLTQTGAGQSSQTAALPKKLKPPHSLGAGKGSNFGGDETKRFFGI